MIKICRETIGSFALIAVARSVIASAVVPDRSN